jgi:small subunit ribosomal protein S8
MKNNDLLSNMFVSINRGILKKEFKVHCKKSKILLNVLSVLFKEGLISGYRVCVINQENIEILLKYSYGRSIIKKITKMSTNGKLVYTKRNELIYKFLYENKYLDGIMILSTNKGLMSHKEAIFRNLGGFLVCRII